MSDTADGPPRLIPATRDREGARRGMGISTLAFKVLADDTAGGLLVIEQANHGRGGPPRHVHPHQDEWFYVVAGEYVIEVGGDTFTLGPGDSLLAPRAVPHVWACAGDGTGRLIVAFTPAGDMEAFFREVTKGDTMPTQDPALWRAHGMEVLGPPLDVS